MAEGSGGFGSGTDDDFDRALRALTEGSAGEAKFRELSAAERAKAGARRAREARKQAKRNARKAGRAARADQRARSSDGYEPAEVRSGGRPGGRRALTGWLALIVILAVSGGLAWLRIGHPFGAKNGAAPSLTGPSATGPSATRPPATGPSVIVPPAFASAVASGPPPDPFSGTPSDRWAEGAAGIVTPAARPVGGYTAAQVAAAYQTTRKLIQAGYLDPPTLRGGPPTAFASLLTASQRQWFDGNLDKTGLDSRGTAVSTRGIVTSFAPGSTRLIGSVIKVTGTMSARAGTMDGRPALIIAVNYRFVYPVEPPATPADWMRIITQLHGSVDFGNWEPSASGLVPWERLATFQAGAQCGTTDGYVHPQYPNGPQGKVQPSGAPTDPYATSTAAPPPGCNAVTRT